MLVEDRGQEPPIIRTVRSPIRFLALAGDRAVSSYRRPSYQALLGRKNPLSSKSVAA